MNKKQPKTGDLVKYKGVRGDGSIIHGVVLSRAVGWADVAWNDGHRGLIRDCDIEVVNESR